MQKRIALLVLFTFVATLASFAQKPSPPASATCDLGGGKSLKTDYSSPRLRGRKMIGDHEPYGKVWRAGANEATTFVTNTDLIVGDKTVPAASYTIFVVPNQDKWTLVISKQIGEWGTDYPGPDKDLARIDMNLSTLPSSVENFTIAYDKAGNGCAMHMDWDTTRASVNIKAK